jgi:hypothetical protein
MDDTLFKVLYTGCCHAVVEKCGPRGLDLFILTTTEKQCSTKR